ncbi:MAG: RHS repeat-associated core domain-containing protein [Candidatus Omnitrophica bacterium]|nr:RHS repeat-associated core domain-containing protein [Candidatus Omnitrophota bacterium]
MVTFEARANLIVDDFAWFGATELSQTSTSSTASVSFSASARPIAQKLTTTTADAGDSLTSAATTTATLPTTYTVKVTPMKKMPDGTFQPIGNKAKPITVNVTSDDASQVTIRIAEENDSPMTGPAGKHWLLHGITSSPSGTDYRHLIQWTGGGMPESGVGFTFSTAYNTKGAYTLKAGSTSSLQFEIYNLTVTWGSMFGQTVWYGYPIIFTATTDPPNFEQNVSWRVDTIGDMRTHADPTSGTGANFTTTFTNPPLDNRFWAQVYADGIGVFNDTDPRPPILSPRVTTVYTPEPQTATHPPFDSAVDGTGQPPPQGYSGGMRADAVGNVLLNSGEFVLSVVDLEIPGRGFPFRFTRTYKSRISYNGPLGFNWDHNYNMRLMRHRNASNQLTGHMLLAAGSGRQDLYVSNGDGTFKSPRGFYTQLRRQPDGSYKLRDRHGMKYLFFELRADADRLFLASITDRNENMMSFTYDSKGLLRTVTDTLGRQVTYSYDLSDRINKATDFSGREVIFGYDGSSGDLISATSPVVLNTSTGNDFPFGKTTKYTYSGNSPTPQLNHNLLSIARPNEVADDATNPSPVLLNSYEEDPLRSYELDKVIMQDFGGVNMTGIPAGGRLHYYYDQLNPGGNPADLTVPRNRSVVIDRNGNVADYLHNIQGQHLQYREFTGRVDLDPTINHYDLRVVLPSFDNTCDQTNPWAFTIPLLRASDPPCYQTFYAYNVEGEITEVDDPEGNRTFYDYDEANPDRYQQGNLLEERNIADMQRGGDGAGSAVNDIVTTYTYEPIFNQVKTVCDPRGNDVAFAPPIDPVEKGCDRYRTSHEFDYQEGTAQDILNLVLAEDAGATVLEIIRLTLNTDINGDGLRNQKSGNVIRNQAPTVHLLPGSFQNQREGDTTQEITTLFGYNSRGQLLFRADPDGSRDEFAYFPESNPHGGGGAFPDADTPPELGGYLGKILKDTTATDNFDNQALLIRSEYFYDKVGNIIRERDSRGVETHYEVNQLNQVVSVARAADVSQGLSDPEEPSWTGCNNPGLVECTQGMVPFAFVTRTFYDFNDNVILQQVEDRDPRPVGQPARPSFEGDINFPLFPLGYPTDADPPGDPAFVDSVSYYDILDNVVEEIEEISNGTNYEDRVTRYRYDRNENQVLEISPVSVSGHQPSNATSSVFDERDLLFISTRGGLTDQFKALDAHDQIPGVAALPNSQDISTFTRNYDKNENLVEFIDGADSSQDADTKPESTLYVYDGFDRLVKTIDAVGSETIQAYDPADNVVSINRRGTIGGPSPTANDISSNVDLASTSYDYDELNRRFRVVDDWFLAQGIVLNRATNVYGSDVAIGGNGTVATIFEYDRRSRLSHVINDNSHVTLNEYDGADRLVKSVDALSNELRYRYDDNGNLTALSEFERSGDNPTGTAEVYDTYNVYDALNRLIRTSDNLGQTTRIQYDSRDNPIRTTDARNISTFTDPLGFFGSLGASGVGNINAPGNGIDYVYDGLSRKISEVRYITTDGLGPIFDAQGSVRSDRLQVNNSANPDGKVVIDFDWDGNDRLVAQTDDGSVSGDQNTSIAVIETTNPQGNATRYVYDDLNRRVQEIFDDFSGHSWSYDVDDNQISKTDANESVLSFTYDVVNRLIKRDIFRSIGMNVQGTTEQIFEYDGLSRLTRATDNNDGVSGNSNDSELALFYDSLSHVVEEKQTHGLFPFSPFIVSRSFDGVGNKTKLIYPSDRCISMTYDSLERLDLIKDSCAGSPTVIADYSYIGPDRILKRVHGNGTGVSIDYDGIKRVNQQRHWKQISPISFVTITEFDYGYDQSGNRTSKVQHHRGIALPRSQFFSYDSLSRLASERVEGTSEDGGSVQASVTQYLFVDGVGNRVLSSKNGQATVFSVNNLNQYTRIVPPVPAPQIDRSYDINGNLADDGSYRFEYDAFNRRVGEKRKSDNSQIASFGYDALNRRVAKALSSAPNFSMIFIYDGQHAIEERSQIQGALHKQYIFGSDLDEVLRTDRYTSETAFEHFYYHTDDLSSTGRMTDASGEVVPLDVSSSYSYGAFGNPLTSLPSPCSSAGFIASSQATQAAADSSPYYTFTGRYYDCETGCYDYRNRHYDPVTGRFLQRDPIGAWDDMNNLGNSYTYVGNNPATLTDPTGKIPPLLLAALAVSLLAGSTQAVVNVATEQPVQQNVLPAMASGFASVLTAGLVVTIPGLSAAAGLGLGYLAGSGSGGLVYSAGAQLEETGTIRTDQLAIDTLLAPVSPLVAAVEVGTTGRLDPALIINTLINAGVYLIGKTYGGKGNKTKKSKVAGILMELAADQITGTSPLNDVNVSGPLSRKTLVTLFDPKVRIDPLTKIRRELENLRGIERYKAKKAAVRASRRVDEESRPKWETTKGPRYSRRDLERVQHRR